LSATYPPAKVSWIGTGVAVAAAAVVPVAEVAGAGVLGAGEEVPEPDRLMACIETLTDLAFFSSVRSSPGMSDCSGTATLSAAHSAPSEFSDARAARPTL
jgi:hypothetical protein